jgi:hypothetical protein
MDFGVEWRRRNRLGGNRLALECKCEHDRQQQAARAQSSISRLGRHAVRVVAVVWEGGSVRE